MSKAQTDDVDTRKKLLDYLTQRMVQGAALNVAGAFLVAALLYDHVEHQLLGAWVAALILTNGLRLLLQKSVSPRSSSQAVSAGLAAGVMVAGLLGAAWGASIWLIDMETDLLMQAMMLIVLTGMLAAGAFSHAAYLPASLAFAVCVLTPLLGWMWSHLVPDWPEMLPLMALYSIAILLFARRSNQQLISAISLATENATLVRQLRDENAIRQQMESAARQAETQLWTLIDTAPDGIVVTNDRGHIVLANAEAHRLFGYPDQGLVGEPVETLVPRAAAHKHVALRESYMDAPTRRLTQSEGPLTGLRRDGTEFPVEIALSPVETEAGQLIFCSVRDLSMHHYVKQLEHEMQERQKAETALDALYREQAAIINATEDLVAHLDMDGRMVWWNDALERVSGLGPEQIKDEFATIIFPEHEHAAVQAAISQVFREGSAVLEADLITRDGTRRYEHHSVILRDEEDRPMGMVSIGRDITAKQENERLVAEAQHIAHLAHWRWNRHSGEFHCSDEAYVIYGLDPAQTSLSREAMFSAVHPDDVEAVRRSVEALQQPGGTQSIDHRILWPDGSVHWLHTESMGVRDADDRLVEIRGTMQEITERKLMEQNLRTSEQRLELAVQGSSDGVWEWDLHTDQVYFSPRWKSMLGYRDDELENNYGTWENLLHPDDLASAKRAVERCLGGDTHRLDTEFRLRHKDGHYVHVLSRGQMTVDDAGRPHRFAGTHVDISERKQAEVLAKGRSRVFQLLASSAPLKEALQAIVELMVSIYPDTRSSILLLDEDGKHLRHGAATKLPDFYNQAVDGLAIGPDVGACGASAFTGERVIVDDIGTHPNWCEFRDVATRAGVRACWSEPIRSSEGRILGSFGSYADEPRGPSAAELALLSDAANLASVAIERHRMRDATRELQGQLQQVQKMEAIGHLAGGIAHDFNNMLATIMGFADLAQMGLDSGKTDKLPAHLAQITQATNRARELVKQLLTFSRVQKGTPSCINLAPLVREVETLLRPTLPSSIALTLETNDLKAVADPVQMHQVLMNLSLNARDAMEGKGTLHLRLAEEHIDPTPCAACHETTGGDFITITVTDNGPGVPPAMLERMFEPFASTKEVGKGSGMGLAITHGIVHEHGGHILVDSRPGHTEFKLLLPKPEQDTGCCSITADPEPDSQAMDTSGRHILLVDDEVSLTTMLSELLGTLGYRVTAFNNGREALEHFKQHPGDVDLVITDQTMPELSGSDMSAAMLAERSDLPIILCTGFSDSINEERARELGIRAFMMKPVSNSALAQEIQQQLAAAETEQQAGCGACSQ